MEVAIKACMRELREVWQIKTTYLKREIILQYREKAIREKYGVETFMEAEQRLKAQKVSRGL